jgi:hypothetical protein
MARTDTHDSALHLVVLDISTTVRAREGLLRRGVGGAGLIRHLKDNRDGLVAASAEFAQCTHGALLWHLQTSHVLEFPFPTMISLGCHLGCQMGVRQIRERRTSQIFGNLEPAIGLEPMTC